MQTRSPAAAYSGPDEPAVSPEETAFSHGPGIDIHAILTGAAVRGHVFHYRCSIESHLFTYIKYAGHQSACPFPIRKTVDILTGWA